jgi:hypothetical protein
MHPTTKSRTGQIRTLGVTAAVWLTVPHLAAVFALLGSVLATAVILTALYGSDVHSERAFRILSHLPERLTEKDDGIRKLGHKKFVETKTDGSTPGIKN